MLPLYNARDTPDVVKTKLPSKYYHIIVRKKLFKRDCLQYKLPI